MVNQNPNATHAIVKPPEPVPQGGERKKTSFPQQGEVLDNIRYSVPSSIMNPTNKRFLILTTQRSSLVTSLKGLMFNHLMAI